MSLLLLEALGALLILLLIVWWTMFSGRPGGELAPPPTRADPAPAAPLEGEEKTGSPRKP
ncbi:MAG: hypothetical protein WAV85_18270 [Rhodoferax sp.]